MIELSPYQMLLIVLDTVLEAVWPLTLMITIRDDEYPYDVYVMQSIAVFVAFLVSYSIDFIRQNYVFPSFNVGWQRVIHKIISSAFIVCGVYLMLLGFKTASSGAAATCGFLALPTFILIELTHAVVWWDTLELNHVQEKLFTTTGTMEVLLVISTCATLFILEDDASKFEGVLLIMIGRLFICIKSYINGRDGEVPPFQGTISNATCFLGINAFMMYVFSQPAAHILEKSAQWENLIPQNWDCWTLIPFFTLCSIYVTNILVETYIGGEMQTITGTSGRILGMYISFTYDVTPTSPIVCSVICITWGVIAYMRLHYRIGQGYESKLTSIDLHEGHKSLLVPQMIKITWGTM